ncbi:AraC-type DNA-binding protein [Oceanospirillum multiglobuliferum]|uniref:HTH araC/xylS-type domain-containing protein n=1 Tax=Oceanospirillum multiglobuliferum TaxID=64969 RepID=A0A1T4LBC8_9GAMM|nr:AraC family transcriptional regulator [Oceanospirillum multiglobuliferum]OPX56729.1 hypothetical protein BTE48_02240 [Oceanospirillum multiglobuliferum]SJZ51848.1 AraC-type DNA-binding protein [Oceanospirillum multiglobuliferum]
MQLGDVQVNFLQTLASAIEHCQKNPWPLFAQYGLAELKASHPEHRISIARYMRLGHEAIELTQRPDIGLLMAEQTKPHHFSIVGLTASCAHRVDQALSTLIEYEALFSQNSRGHSSIERTDTGAFFCFYSISPYNQYNRFVVDAVLASWLILVEQISGISRVALKKEGAYISIECTQPHYAKAYNRLAIPIHFSAEKNALWLPNKVIEQVCIQHNPISFKQLKNICEQKKVQQLKGRSISQQVQEAIAMQLTGKTPTLQEVAQQLNQESWTLRRRLNTEGTQFKKLLDETRSALATRYVRDTQLSFGEISYLLGFSAPAAFHRAFQRWHNKPAGQYRSESI